MSAAARQEGLSRSEAEVLRRWDAGQSKEMILRAGIAPAIVSRALSYSSEKATNRMNSDIRAGSVALLASLQRAGFARG